ncbi:MAG TPA: energy transducer TonB [Ignavibacteriaceae bacterium]|nr:energy transducer TonB [Ignavibacteriaceae bacterium]
MSFVTSRVNALNRSYKRGIEVSYIIVLLLIIAAFKFAPMKDRTDLFKRTGAEIFIPTLVDPSRQTSLPPSKPAPPIPEIALSNDEIQDIILESSDIFDNSNIPLPPERPSIPEIIEEVVPFYKLESYPEPIGGLEAFVKKIHYTELARRAGIEGTVVIEFIIDKTGNVEEARVIKSLDAGLDKVALQAVKETKFTPGLQRDKPVKVKMTIPIKFRLN